MKYLKMVVHGSYIRGPIAYLIRKLVYEKDLSFNDLLNTSVVW